MIEDLLWLIVAVVVFAVLRSVIGIVLKGVSDFFGTAASSPGSPQRPRSTPQTPESLKPEPLKKDPVCGTFLPASNAIRKTVRGETYYFCSVECRDKFAG